MSPLLRHELLRCAAVRRFDAGEQIVRLGRDRPRWLACASGAVRIGTGFETGRRPALSYLKPGEWFGDPGAFDGGHSNHDAHAHGPTTVLMVCSDSIRQLALANNEFAVAALTLQSCFVRMLHEALRGATSLSLKARVARQLTLLARLHEMPAEKAELGLGIRLSLRQGALAGLVGCSRQRVNVQLKQMEREGCIRVGRQGLVIHDIAALTAAATDLREISM